MCDRIVGFRRSALINLALTALALVALAACDDANAPDDPRSDSSPDTTPPPASPQATPYVRAGLTLATVTRVVDGDTIRVEIDGEEMRVRYIGIDTPETVDPRQPVECFGVEASERNRQLVEDRVVGLEKDISETDAFGRLLRYVWIGDQMVNATLIEEGYALASTYPPDVRYAELFASLQAQARVSERGLWGPICQSASPSPLTAGGCEYSSTGEPAIKGNISIRTGEKIYHVPGGEFYDDTIIDAAKGERFFCTEAEAVSAGWRRSLR